MSAPLLEVRSLHVESGAGTIVDALDLDVAPGQTVGIVGESGSGKSMTARALVGLLPPGVTARGHIRLHGEELLPSSERTWRRIRGSRVALLLQDPFTMLNPLMPVGAQIVETVRDAAGRRLSREARRAEALRRLAEVGIADASVADRYPFQLSGGMRQRVGLASALASDPELLIADEPSTALDVTTQREILRLIRSTQRNRDMGVILITHDLRVAFSVCERINVLYAGALLEVGDARAMEERPGHPYTHGLLTSEPPLERRLARLVAIPGNVPAAAEVLDECAFATRCRWVAAECRARRPALAELEPGRASACIRIADIRSQLIPKDADAGEILVTPESEEVEAIVRMRNLVKVFGGRQVETTALAGVTMHVDAGESVGLVGESGSGKTTLARCLVGLERPSEGEIRVGGVDVTDYESLSAAQRAAARQTVQIVFQDPYSTLNPVRTVNFTLFEALRRVPGREGMPRRRVSDLLELVQLPASYAERKPAALSGGERQRVAIARALALQPKILVCDEPVSSLDVSVQAQVLNLLDDLRRTLGVGYLFISHDLAVVRQVTDRVYVLHRGVVVEAGPTERVLDCPEHPYTRSLIDSVPQSDPTWLAPLAAPTQL